MKGTFATPGRPLPSIRRIIDSECTAGKVVLVNTYGVTSANMLGLAHFISCSGGIRIIGEPEKDAANIMNVARKQEELAKKRGAWSTGERYSPGRYPFDFRFYEDSISRLINKELVTVADGENGEKRLVLTPKGYEALKVWRRANYNAEMIGAPAPQPAAVTLRKQSNAGTTAAGVSP